MSAGRWAVLLAVRLAPADAAIAQAQSSNRYVPCRCPWCRRGMSRHDPVLRSSRWASL